MRLFVIRRDSNTSHVNSNRSRASGAESSDKNALDASITQIAIGAPSTKHVSRYLACNMVALYDGEFDRCRISWKLPFQSFSTISLGLKMAENIP